MSKKQIVELYARLKEIEAAKTQKDNEANALKLNVIKMLATDRQSAFKEKQFITFLQTQSKELFLQQIAVGQEIKVLEDSLVKKEPEYPYCHCRKDTGSLMVECDNATCPYDRLHWSCCGLTAAPKGEWFCSLSCKWAHDKSGVKKVKEEIDDEEWIVMEN